MEIRYAALEDLSLIVDLHKKSFRGILSGELSRQYLLNFYRELLKRKDCVVFIAWLNNELAGFIAGSCNGKYLSEQLKLQPIIEILLLSPVDILRAIKKGIYYKILRVKAELIVIAVNSKYQRKGLGKRLVEKLENFFREKNIQHYHVFTNNKVSKGLDFYYFLKFKKILTIRLFGHKGTFLRK